MRRLLVTALIAATCANSAQAQVSARRQAGNPPVAPPPANLTPAEAEIWPYPPPDPRAWWTDKWPKPPEAADPLGGRRVPKGARLPVVENGIDPSTYRLWGLMPLQWEVIHPGEMILEVWVRPSNSVRQSVARLIVRRDGKAFIQGRAGFACCEADIGRRIGFDAELPAGSAPRFLPLRDHPMWASPRMVQVAEAGAAEGLCVSGIGYDVTLLVQGRARSLHRDCDDAAVGQAADAIEPVLKAALGHDPRFDVIYARGADFSGERKAYQDLLATGGSLRANPQGRARAAETPLGAEPMPRPESTPATPGPAAGPSSGG